jgi:hypothetical protein
MHRTDNLCVTLAESVNDGDSREHLAAMSSGFRHISAR